MPREIELARCHHWRIFCYDADRWWFFRPFVLYPFPSKGLYNAGLRAGCTPFLSCSGPSCFGSSNAGNDEGCYGADVRAGKGWGNKGKEELPGRRFLVRTRFSSGVSSATGVRV